MSHAGDNTAAKKGPVCILNSTGETSGCHRDWLGGRGVCPHCCKWMAGGPDTGLYADPQRRPLWIGLPHPWQTLGTQDGGLRGAGSTAASQALAHWRVKRKNMEMCLSSSRLRAPRKPFCMHPLPSCHTYPPAFVSSASFLPERSPITAPKPLTGVSCIQLTDSPKPLQK